MSESADQRSSETESDAATLSPRNSRSDRLDPPEIVDARPVPDRSRHDPRLDVGLEQSRFTSPLPRPDDLERYEMLLPGAAERLLAAGEREQAHRHEIERRLVALDEQAVPSFHEGQRRGHWISLSLGVGYELVMLAAILEGEAVAGITGAAIGLGAMIWAVRRDPSDTRSDDDAEDSGEDA